MPLGQNHSILSNTYCRFKVRTLEEAEQEMEGSLHARQAMANSRLAALVANGKQPLCKAAILNAAILAQTSLPSVCRNKTLSTLQQMQAHCDMVVSSQKDQQSLIGK